MRSISKIAATVAATVVVLGGGAFALASSAGAATPHVSRPDAALRHADSANTPVYPVTAVTDEFQTGIGGGFCPAHSGNLPCNGAVGNYGVISRAVSEFSNGGAGNYAPAAPALPGQEFYAWTSGAQMDNRTGCPNAAVEYCTGPFALFGKGKARGQENQFPAGGFTVTADLYLDPAAIANLNPVLTADVGLNGSTGTYLADEFINFCPETGGLAVSNTYGSCASTNPVITAAGWYRLIWQFADASGNAVVTERVEAESHPGTALYVSELDAPVVPNQTTAITAAGGPGYFWLPTEDVMGLPLGNFALQLGQQPNGHTP